MLGAPIVPCAFRRLRLDEGIDTDEKNYCQIFSARPFGSRATNFGREPMGGSRLAFRK